jgi:hypothetical protein
MEKAYKNTGYFMLLLIPVAAVGFYTTYFSHLSDLNESFTAITHSSVTIFHHIHASLATLWILLLISQPLFIRYRRFKIHKAIGKISYFVFPLLILSFIPLIIIILESNYSIRAYNPIADATLLILFYSLAVYNRKNMPRHMRYMIGTATVFLSPSVARIGKFIIGWQPKISINFLVFGTVYLILTGLILLDRKHGKNFRPYILMLVVWIINQIVFNILIL